MNPPIPDVQFNNLNQCICDGVPARGALVDALGKEVDESAPMASRVISPRNWRVVGQPKRVFTIACFYGGNDSVNNCVIPPGPTFNNYVAMACSNYGRVSGVAFQWAPPTQNADFIVFSRKNSEIGALGRHWYGTPWIGVSHTMHNGKPWTGNYLMWTIQHEMGHRLGDLGWPNAHAPANEYRATMNPNNHRMPFRYPNSGKYNRTHDVAGFWFPEWQYLQRTYGGPHWLWYTEPL